MTLSTKAYHVERSPQLTTGLTNNHAQEEGGPLASSNQQRHLHQGG
jgi:hypothetical protein